MNNCWTLVWVFVGAMGISLTHGFAQQDPYRLSWRGDLVVYGLGSAAGIWAYWEKTQVQPLTQAELIALDPADLNAFDRPATHNWSPSAARASDVMLAVSAAAPLCLFAAKAPRKGMVRVLLMYGEVLVINQALTDFTKNVTLRVRPLAYNPAVPDGEKYKVSARRAFFSGHTSTSASLSFFGAKVFNDYFPQSRLRPWVWGLAAVIPATTGYLRFHAGKHFPTDLIAGYATGAAIGILVPHFHERRPATGSSWQVYPALHGVGMIWKF